MTPQSDLRRAAFATMIVAAISLALTLALGDDPASTQNTQAAGQPDVAVTRTPFPTSAPTPNPFAVSSADNTITITRLWSPAPNVARAEGTATGNPLTVSFSIDGVTQPDATIRSENGEYTLDLLDLEPGPQEICLADACQRVLVSSPDQEARDIIEARIDQAGQAAAARFPYEQLLADWAINVAGPNSSTGGSTDPATHTITIYANSGRSLDEYEITVLHELGHAVDTDFMTQSTRQQFRDIRGHAPDLVWGPAEEFAVGDDRWRNSAEDFAEVFVAWVLANDYDIMSTVVAPQPTMNELHQFCLLIALDGVVCE